MIDFEQIVVSKEDPKKVKQDVTEFRKNLSGSTLLHRKHEESLRIRQIAMTRANLAPAT